LVRQHRRTSRVATLTCTSHTEPMLWSRVRVRLVRQHRRTSRVATLTCTSHTEPMLGTRVRVRLVKQLRRTSRVATLTCTTHTGPMLCCRHHMSSAITSSGRTPRRRYLWRGEFIPTTTEQLASHGSGDHIPVASLQHGSKEGMEFLTTFCVGLT